MSDKENHLTESVLDMRRRLDALDLQILELIAERQALVTRIGERKHRDGKALRDFRREREVIELGMQRAESLGLSGDIARDIMERLIHHSLSKQEQRQIVASGHGAGRTALVIGGLGRMGDWLARYLDSLGYAVEIADPGEGETLFPRVENWLASDLDHDLIAVCAPLRVSNLILQQLAERRHTEGVGLHDHVLILGDERPTRARGGHRTARAPPSRSRGGGRGPKKKTNGREGYE